MPNRRCSARQNVETMFLYRSETILSGTPNKRYQLRYILLAVSLAVSVVRHGMILTYPERRQVTVMNWSYLSLLVIGPTKSVEMSVSGREGIGREWSCPALRVVRDLYRWHPSHVETYILTSSRIPVHTYDWERR